MNRYLRRDIIHFEKEKNQPGGKEKMEEINALKKMLVLETILCFLRRTLTVVEQNEKYKFLVIGISGNLPSRLFTFNLVSFHPFSSVFNKLSGHYSDKYPI